MVDGPREVLCSIIVSAISFTTFSILQNINIFLFVSLLDIFSFQSSTLLMGEGCLRN